MTGERLFDLLRQELHVGPDSELELSPTLQRYVQRVAAPSGDQGRFRGRIHPQDEMFHNTVGRIFAPEEAYIHYFVSGMRTMKFVNNVADRCLGGLETCESVLEFASGHGRLTRHLVLHLDRKKLWTSDIYPSAVDWQREYFGVNAFLSCLNPDDLIPPRRFDLIIVGSLFSHLPENLFKSWLKRMYSMLTERGVLCISTVSDRTNVGMGRIGDMGPDGILFVPMECESDSLPQEVYGRTIVTDDFIKRTFFEALGQEINYLILRDAMYEYQDVCLIAKDLETLLDPRDLVAPIGGVSGVWKVGDTKISVSGWAIDLNPRQQIGCVRVLVDGEKATEAAPRVTTPEEGKEILQYFPGRQTAPVRWECTFDREKLRPDSLVTAVISSEGGPFLELYVDVAKLA